VKATGTGITVNLQDLSFQTNSPLVPTVIFDTVLFKESQRLLDWTFEESTLDEEHCVSVSRNFKADVDPFEMISISDLIPHNASSISPQDCNYSANFMAKDEKP